MPSFLYSQTTSFVLPHIHEGLPYLLPSDARLRYDEFTPRLPLAPFSAPGYVLQRLDTSSLSPLVWPALNEVGIPSFTDLTFSPFPTSLARMDLDFLLEKKTAEVLQARMQQLVLFGERELRAMWGAAAIYGATVISDWDSWPNSKYTVALDEPGDPFPVRVPWGLSRLAEELGTVLDAVAPFSLEVFRAALALVPGRLPCYFVMNQRTLLAFLALWEDIYKQPAILVVDPQTGLLLPSYRGVPILVSNFITTATPDTAPSPERNPDDENDPTPRSSIFLVHLEPSQEGHVGLCGLYPHEFPASPLQTAWKKTRDDDDQLTLRFSLSFGFAVRSAFDVVRVRGFALPAEEA